MHLSSVAVLGDHLASAQQHKQHPISLVSLLLHFSLTLVSQPKTLEVPSYFPLQSFQQWLVGCLSFPKVVDPSVKYLACSVMAVLALIWKDLR